MKRQPLLLALLLVAAGQVVSQTPYTRGIGVYPGQPNQDASPRMEKGGDDPRNLALNRITKASSQFDNNLTAQLATDGIVEQGQPRYLRVTTPAGLVPRREREWSLDECPYTHNVLPGADSYICYELVGWRVQPDSVVVDAQVAYHPEKAQADDRYLIAVDCSADGVRWVELARQEGKGLPGRPSSSRLHDDPDKRLGQGPLPTRTIDHLRLAMQPIPFPADATSGITLRLRVWMPSASHWAVSQANFYNFGRRIDMKPAQYFTSAWMSAVRGEAGRKRGDDAEWVSVDLGATSQIESVNLHWLQRA
ncbi:MAG: beta-glycosidase, partial [Bacteroidaceae bacterium]|nr:beta-glycosidase [Bacteroidaceae bacterium]